VTWDASASQTYYLLVQGANSFESGNFELFLGTRNDVCNTAMGPIAVGGNPVLGSTEFATVDEGHIDCFLSESIDGPGIWYTVIGADSLLKFSTCSLQKSFFTRVSVYSGPCQSLNCVAGNDRGAECGDASSVMWFASLGKTYSVLVHGAVWGNFALKVVEVENSCDSAQHIFLSGASETAFSPRTVSEAYIDTCSGEVASNQVGAWYSIAGNGGQMRFDGCKRGDRVNQTTSLSVYTDICTSLTCVANSDNACAVVVDTDFGEEYTVYVQASSTDATVPLELNVYASNDHCSTAFGPLERGSVVRGSNIDATNDVVELCGNMTSRGAGVWYSLIGAGETLTVFTCSDFTDFDTQMTLFEGDDCDHLQCVASQDDNCDTATWMEHLFTKERLYYVLVSGKPGEQSTGNFELRVQ
jgi:hypothetical protein